MKPFRPTSSRKKDEQGVAILMALGVLSLLMVLALSFAAASLQAQKKSMYAEALVKARILSESGVQLVYAQLSVELADPNLARNKFGGSKGTAVGRYGPVIASSSWNGRVYWFSHGTDDYLIQDAMHFELNGIDITPDAALPSADIGWVHVLDPGGEKGIIGRISYVVIDDSGKIDPNGVINDSTAEGTESDSRIGTNAQDISLLAALDTVNLARKFQHSGVGTGELPANRIWDSRYHIFAGNSSADASAATISEVQQAILPYSYDIEAFNNDGNDRHRFQLDRADWNAVQVSAIAKEAALYYTDYNLNETNDGGIEWLNNASSSTLRDQVIANLIDYCDSDSTATTDNPADPTYMGLEKVPYINDILIDARSNGNNVVVGLQPELVNIHEVDLGDGGELTIELVIVSDDFGEQTLTFSWSTGDVDAQDYDRLGRDQEQINVGSSGSHTNFKVKVNSASYVDGSGNLWDFAKMNYSPSVTITSTALSYTVVECDDPRQNLAATDWEWLAAWVPVLGGTGTNSNCNPNPDPTDTGVKDVETGATDPWDVSTAYIRNAPIQSLWELGAIHRGAAWETINLRKHNDAALNGTGLAAYSLGDANILAQVKMGDEFTSQGNININTNSQKALVGLLAGVPVGGTYAAPIGTNATVSTSNAEDIAGTFTSLAAGEIMFENGADPASYGDLSKGNSPFINRGGIANATKISDGTAYTTHGLAQDNDREKEEIIGKIANITTVRPNYFTVLVTSQIISDKPDGYMGGSRGTFESNIDTIEAEQKVMTILHRDAFTNTFNVKRYEYIDE